MQVQSAKPPVPAEPSSAMSARLDCCGRSRSRTARSRHDTSRVCSSPVMHEGRFADLLGRCEITWCHLRKLTFRLSFSPIDFCVAAGHLRAQTAGCRARNERVRSVQNGHCHDGASPKQPLKSALFTRGVRATVQGCRLSGNSQLRTKANPRTLPLLLREGLSGRRHSSLRFPPKHLTLGPEFRLLFPG